MSLPEVLKRMSLAAFVILPLTAAAAFVALYARDAHEVGFSLLAVAGALSLASFLQIGLLIRETRRLGGAQSDMRQQTLALARCMRDLSQRLTALETNAPSQPTVEAQALPPEPPSRAVEEPPAAPQGSPLVERRLLTLPQRRLAGIEIAARPDAAMDRFARSYRAMAGDGCLSERIRAAADLIARPLQPESAFVLVSTDLPLAETPESVALLLQLAAEQPEVRQRMRIGISQRAVRMGGSGEAQALARLARAGLGFVLTEVTDIALDATALHACNIHFVRVDARHLLALVDSQPAAGLIGGQLADGGVSLICDGVDDARLVPELIDLGVALIEGSALSRDPARAASVVPLQPRVEPVAAPAPPLVRVQPEDRLRRFAG